MMDKRIAQAEIVTKLRDYSAFADLGLHVSNVERLSDWLSSKEFCAICRAADADADAIIAKFDSITSRAFDAALTNL
jgi:hypothetical protein